MYTFIFILYSFFGVEGRDMIVFYFIFGMIKETSHSMSEGNFL